MGVGSGEPCPPGFSHTIPQMCFSSSTRFVKTSLSYIYRYAKFFNFFARLFILFDFGKIKQTSERKS